MRITGREEDAPDLWPDKTDAHPAGRGDPAPLTALSILPLPGSEGCAGIRVLRTQLDHTKTGSHVGNVHEVQTVHR